MANRKWLFRTTDTIDLEFASCIIARVHAKEMCISVSYLDDMSLEDTNFVVCIPMNIPTQLTAPPPNNLHTRIKQNLAMAVSDDTHMISRSLADLGG